MLRNGAHRLVSRTRPHMRACHSAVYSGSMRSSGLGLHWRALIGDTIPHPACGGRTETSTRCPTYARLTCGTFWRVFMCACPNLSGVLSRSMHRGEEARLRGGSPAVARERKHLALCIKNQVRDVLMRSWQTVRQWDPRRFCHPGCVLFLHLCGGNIFEQLVDVCSALGKGRL